MSQIFSFCDIFVWEALKKVASDGQARRNQVKKRNLQIVNEHFEPEFQRIMAERSSFSEFP
ncbi:MAG: hypothetical protein HRU78_00220 [Gammaproteobacteria bacterium]|nr:MAG: hypothetical protein HRU78_00220 [Gammaproteobacteria bacterium]